MRLNCSRPSEEALVKGLQVLGRLLNERERRDRRELSAAQTRRSLSFAEFPLVPARFICIFLSFSRVLATNA